jgi:ubiquinone/menaquinone biosynthesis C-methylase UbiE
MAARSPDPDSLRYARYWEPVLAGPARRLLERIVTEPRHVLDIGAGTGSLALAAVARWPGAAVTALDASAGMLSVAQERAATELAPTDAGRLTWLVADAGSMPLPAASVDVATAAFVLQLVPDRSAVLAEVRRVLRRGAVLGLVTWLASDLSPAADETFADALRAMGSEAPCGEFRPVPATDYETLDEVRDELAAAGFEAVDVVADELRHTWGREAYLEFKEQFDERDAFESLDEDGRARLRESVRAGWSRLPERAFAVSWPLVSAIARRP